MAPPTDAIPMSPYSMKRSAARLSLSLALLAGDAPASENWQHIGDYYARQIRAQGAFSLNFATLRRREYHFEIWEKLTPPADDAARHAEWLTLWGIRCRSGLMAKITEGAAGAFEPRAATLHFFLPAPGSSGAAIIEATCNEVRRRPPAASDKAEAERDSLVQPPAIIEDDLLEREEQ